MASPVVILLPPSEAKLAGGTDAWSPDSGRFASLATNRRAVATALAGAMADDGTAGRITGVRGLLGDRARDANATALGGPARPAWQRYRGVVWEHLDPATLAGRARARASSIVVVSALGGVWGFDDPVPEYKCKMAAGLPPLGMLSSYWRPLLARALDDSCRGAIVWDLLPEEHAKAVTVPETARRLLRVEPRTAAGRAVGHAAKAVKGRFARHLLETGAGAGRASLSGLVEAFAWPGWSARLEGRTAILECH